MTVPNLTSAEFEQLRTPAALLAWVLQTLERFGESEAGKDAVPFGTGLAKQLVEEAYPLARFADRHHGPTRDVTIQLRLGAQNYDATVTDRRASAEPIQFLEVTQAHEGEAAFLQMLHLKEHGHVSPIGPVPKSGTRASGLKVQVESVARRHEDIRAEQFGYIAAAVQRKQSKAYPAETALVVGFDDWMVVRDEADRSALRQICDPLARSLSGRFQALAIAGDGGHAFEFYPLWE